MASRFARRSRVTGNGGKFLLLPPGYKGEVPKGYFVYRSGTNNVFIFLRAFYQDPKNLTPAVALGEQSKIYPLSRKGAPKAMTPHPSEKGGSPDRPVGFWRPGTHPLLPRPFHPGCPDGRLGHSRCNLLPPVVHFVWGIKPERIADAVSSRIGLSPDECFSIVPRVSERSSTYDEGYFIEAFLISECSGPDRTKPTPCLLITTIFLIQRRRAYKKESLNFHALFSMTWHAGEAGVAQILGMLPKALRGRMSKMGSGRMG
jgi:hypothetical protein